MDRISLNWKNASTRAVGQQHGVSEKDLAALAGPIKKLTKQFADQRKAGELRFRELPYNEDMLDAIESQVEHFRDRCEVLIILGIGGSALGNIALQSALNPSTYNLMSDRTRSGPQLFVLDNVDPEMIKATIDHLTPKIKKNHCQCHQQERRDSRNRLPVHPLS